MTLIRGLSAWAQRLVITIIITPFLLAFGLVGAGVLFSISAGLTAGNRSAELVALVVLGVLILAMIVVVPMLVWRWLGSMVVDDRD